MIKELRIKAYGGLKDVTIPLEEGLNIIYGHNEAGKSTITSFLRSMLFGMSQTRARSIGENDRKRLKPWDGDGFGGSLLYQDKEGREYLIRREFKATVARDTLQVTDARTGQDLPQFGRDFGSVLWGISGETFEQTAFVRQGGAKVVKNDELIARITNLVSTAQEEVGYESTRKSIKALKDSLRRERGKNGLLDLMEENRRQLALHQQQLEEGYQHCLAYMEELSKVEEEIRGEQRALEEAKDARSFAAYQQAAAQYEKIFALKTEISNLTSSLELLRRLVTYQGFVPDQQYLADTLACLQQWQQSQQRMEQLTAEQQQLKDQEEKYAAHPLMQDSTLEQDLAALREQDGRIRWIEANLEAKAPLLAQRQRIAQQLEGLFQGDTAPFCQDEVRRRAEGLFEEQLQSGKEKRTRLMVGGVLAVAGVLGFVVHPLLGVGLFVALGAYLLSGQRKVGRREKGNQEFLRQLGVSSLDELEQRYRAYTQEKQQEIQWRQELQQLEQAIDFAGMEQLKKEQAQLEEDMADIMKRHSCQGVGQMEERLAEAKELSYRMNTIKTQLADLRTQQEELEKHLREAQAEFTARREQMMAPRETFAAYAQVLEERQKQLSQMAQQQLKLEEKQAFLATLLQDGQEEKLKEEYLEYKRRRAEGSTPQNSGDEEALTRALMAAKERRAELSTKISQYTAGEKDLSQTSEEMMQLDREMEEKQKYYEALTLAYDGLEQAMEQMSQQFSPKLTALVGENLSQLTDGKYQGVLIDKDYNIKVQGQDGNSYALDYFSAGTIDQIYLAFRLGLLQVVEGEEPLPLIFDDTFCHYDDGRLSAALSLLKKAAEKHQIILLSCQKRELEALEGDKYHQTTLA